MLAIARGPFDVEVVNQADAPTLLWVGRPIAAHASARGQDCPVGTRARGPTRYVKALTLPAFTAHIITDDDRFLQELDAVAQRGHCRDD